MSDQDERAAYFASPSLAESQAWDAASDRAADETAARRTAYANALIADTERMADVLYQRLSEVSPEADRLCETVARLLVRGESPDALLACLAAEEAENEVAECDPEQYLTDDGEYDDGND